MTQHIADATAANTPDKIVRPLGLSRHLSVPPCRPCISLAWLGLLAVSFGFVQTKFLVKSAGKYLFRVGKMAEYLDKSPEGTIATQVGALLLWRYSWVSVCREEAHGLRPFVRIEAHPAPVSLCAFGLVRAQMDWLDASKKTTVPALPKNWENVDCFGIEDLEPIVVRSLARLTARSLAGCLLLAGCGVRVLMMACVQGQFWPNSPQTWADWMGDTADYVRFDDDGGACTLLARIPSALAHSFVL